MRGRRWTPEEDQLLEELIGDYTAEGVARKMKRSFNSINCRLYRLGIPGFGKSTDRLTMNQLCKMMGVDSRTVKKKWKEHGLIIRHKGQYKIIGQADLIKFLKNHPEDWNAADVTDDSIIGRYPWYKEKRKTDVKTQYFWTPEDISTLKYLRHEGYSIREIAEKMGRSESSIKGKLYGGKQRGISIRSKGQRV